MPYTDFEGENIVMRDGAPCDNPSLIILRSKGYDLGVLPATTEPDGECIDAIGFWYARKNGEEFVAGDPLALLGIVTIWENLPNWREATREVDLIDELLGKAFPD